MPRAPRNPRTALPCSPHPCCRSADAPAQPLAVCVPHEAAPCPHGQPGRPLASDGQVRRELQQGRAAGGSGGRWRRGEQAAGGGARASCNSSPLCPLSTIHCRCATGAVRLLLRMRQLSLLVTPADHAAAHAGASPPATASSHPPANAPCRPCCCACGNCPCCCSVQLRRGAASHPLPPGRQLWRQHRGARLRQQRPSAGRTPRRVAGRAAQPARQPWRLACQPRRLAALLAWLLPRPAEPGPLRAPAPAQAFVDADGLVTVVVGSPLLKPSMAKLNWLPTSANHPKSQHMARRRRLGCWRSCCCDGGGSRRVLARSRLAR